MHEKYFKEIQDLQYFGGEKKDLRNGWNSLYIFLPPLAQRHADSPARRGIRVAKRSGILREGVVVNDSRLVVMETLA